MAEGDRGGEDCTYHIRIAKGQLSGISQCGQTELPDVTYNMVERVKTTPHRAY